MMARRRDALRHAVQSELRPAIEAAGFQSTRRKATKARWAALNPWGFDYARERGEQIDFLTIYWEKYGRPMFAIEFGTCRRSEIGEGEAPESWRGGRLRTGRGAVQARLLGWNTQWFGLLAGPLETVGHGIERMRDLDNYLLRGIESPYVDVYQGSRGEHIFRPRSAGQRAADLLLMPWDLTREVLKILWILLAGERSKPTA